jgi:superfamily II RNA helicase
MIYDRFQLESIQYIDEGHSLIVSAPTGSGKTVIAEYVIEKSFKENKGCIYTAPLKPSVIKNIVILKPSMGIPM